MLVKTYTEDYYSTSAPDQHLKDSFGLTYDNKGRLLSLTELDSTYGLQLLYHYQNDNTITLDQYDSGKVQVHELLYLNSFSYLDSTFQYNNEGDSSTEKYIYNAGKQLVQLNTYDYSSADGSSLREFDTYAYDSYNDIIKEVDNNVSDPGNPTVVTSTYTNQIINNLNIGLNVRLPQKYLPDIVTGTLAGETQSATHVYTFDNKKRLTMDQATLSNGYIAIKRYYY